MRPSDEAIRRFWLWFSTIAAQLGSDLADEQLLAELDQRIEELGDFAWEIGPGLGAENALSISPGGDHALLAETRLIVDLAPKIAGWEFHPAKPPKEWEARFEMEGPSGESVEVNAAAWRYIATSSGPRYMVTVEMPNPPDLPEEYVRWAVEIALDGIMGEEQRLELIEELSVTDRFQDEAARAASPILEIRNLVH